MVRILNVAFVTAFLTFACSEDVSGPREPVGSYWPAEVKTWWVSRGRWEDLSGEKRGGPFGLKTVIAGTAYDAQGRPVKIWRTSELDGDYFFRVAGDEVWANWAEANPKGDYHLWLMLPPADGQYWEDDKYRVSVRGPFELNVPYGEFGDVYRARYDYVEEAGHYEVWWYASGVGCILYEHYVPDEKHELVELVEFSTPK